MYFCSKPNICLPLYINVLNLLLICLSKKSFLLFFLLFFLCPLLTFWWWSLFISLTSCFSSLPFFAPPGPLSSFPFPYFSQITLVCLRLLLTDPPSQSEGRQSLITAWQKPPFGELHSTFYSLYVCVRERACTSVMSVCLDKQCEAQCQSVRQMSFSLTPGWTLLLQLSWSSPALQLPQCVSAVPGFRSFSTPANSGRTISNLIVKGVWLGNVSNEK